MGAIDDVSTRISEALLELMSKTPTSKQKVADDPLSAARGLTRAAARKSAAVSGSLAIPPGPIGLLTVLPDLILIWRIQQQLVADIAAVFGRTEALNAQTMTYCMFRHSSSAIVRDLVARVGGRSLVRRTTVRMIKSVLKRIGLRIARLLLGKSVARLIPLVGAAAVAGYAYYDTIKVAGTAIELFSRHVQLES